MSSGFIHKFIHEDVARLEEKYTKRSKVEESDEIDIEDLDKCEINSFIMTEKECWSSFMDESDSEEEEEETEGSSESDSDTENHVNGIRSQNVAGTFNKRKDLSTVTSKRPTNVLSSSVFSKTFKKQKAIHCITSKFNSQKSQKDVSLSGAVKTKTNAYEMDSSSVFSDESGSSTTATDGDSLFQKYSVLSRSAMKKNLCKKMKENSKTNKCSTDRSDLFATDDNSSFENSSVHSKYALKRKLCVEIENIEINTNKYDEIITAGSQCEDDILADENDFSRIGSEYLSISHSYISDSADSCDEDLLFQ